MSYSLENVDMSKYAIEKISIFLQGSYHIGDPWLMGGKFIILLDWSVSFARPMNVLMMSALAPFGSGSF